MKKESRSQTRGVVARQQTQTRTVETVAASRKQSKKVLTSTSVVYDTPGKDTTKSSTKGRSTSLSAVSSGKSRDIKQTSASDVASHDTAVAPATMQQLPDANKSGSNQEKVSSVRKERSDVKTPDKKAIKSRRWVRGGPIEYSTPPSDHSTDKTGVEGITVKQKVSSDSRDSTKGKSAAKKNIALAFDAGDKGADVKAKSKYSDSVPSTVAGAKRKKSATQQGVTEENKGSSMSKASSRKNPKSSATVKVEPEPTRTKRMARLNAEAIVSLLYKHDDQVARSSKFRDSDNDVDTDSSDFSFEDEQTPAAKRSRAKTSQRDVPGTSKNEQELGDHGFSKKNEARSTTKRVARKSDKSSKIQPKGCKKKSVEAVFPSGWSPPKRMASLNAQVCFLTC